MKLSSYQVNDITVAKVETNRIDYEVASEFKNQLIGLLEKGVGAALLLDLSVVRYLDSSGLGALIAAYRTAGGKTKMGIAGADATVANTLRIGRIANLIPVLRNVSDIRQLTSADW